MVMLLNSIEWPIVAAIFLIEISFDSFPSISNVFQLLSKHFV